jgi:aldehyde dehydrogenase (NAD+)
MSELETRHSPVPALTEWDYAPAPEAREIVQLEKRYGLFIGGRFVKPRSGEWFASVSPSSEETLAEVAQANE